jgi:hypothetical protein
MASLLPHPHVAHPRRHGLKPSSCDHRVKLLVRRDANLMASDLQGTGEIEQGREMTKTRNC